MANNLYLEHVHEHDDDYEYVYDNEKTIGEYTLLGDWRLFTGMLQ